MASPAGQIRALIIGDIEGITGVDDWRHIMDGHPGYDEACRNYEADVNAAVQGLRAGGAGDVLVVDTHSAGGNIQAENLHDCRLIGGPSIMGRLDQAFADGVEAVVLLGFHAAAGTPDGFVPHSFAVQTRSWLDGKLAGEPAFYALLAGAAGIPVIAVTGDAQTIHQLRDFAPDAHPVQTKTSDSPWQSTSRDAASTRTEITRVVQDAFRERASIQPAVPPPTLTLTIEAQSEVAATLIGTIPGMAPAAAPRTHTYSAAWPDLWRAFIAANSLAALSTMAGGSWYYGPIAGGLGRRALDSLEEAARPITGAFYAEQFSPPWGPACPPELRPWNEAGSA